MQMSRGIICFYNWQMIREPKSDSSMIGLNEATASEWSSEQERKGDALALGADEGRSDLRKATGSRKQAMIRGYPNGETRLESSPVTVY